nr:hypothetical protein [Odoribacter splanchnicus]
MIKTSVCYLSVLAAIIVGACNTKTAGPKKENPVRMYEGDYVTDGYARRAEGYDWSVVSVTRQTDSTVNVSVRSRADIKKESCSFHATAFFRRDTLVAKYEDADIFFVISADTLEISSDTPGLLYFFCSGGGTLAGEYIRLHERLDVSQLADKTTPPEYR